MTATLTFGLYRAYIALREQNSLGGREESARMFKTKCFQMSSCSPKNRSSYLGLPEYNFRFAQIFFNWGGQLPLLFYAPSARKLPPSPPNRNVVLGL